MLPHKESKARKIRGDGWHPHDSAFSCKTEQNVCDWREMERYRLRSRSDRACVRVSGSEVEREGLESKSRELKAIIGGVEFNRSRAKRKNAVKAQVT